MEINFYQIDDILYKSIAPLLLKILEDNKKALIYCPEQQQATEIDDGLWSFSKTKFLPHIIKNEQQDNKKNNKLNLKQPIIISLNQQNHNQAEYLISTAEVEENFLKQFKKFFFFFSSTEIDKARNCWKAYKNQSFIVNFYKKNQDGWVKINTNITN